VVRKIFVVLLVLLLLCGCSAHLPKDTTADIVTNTTADAVTGESTSDATTTNLPDGGERPDVVPAEFEKCKSGIHVAEVCLDRDIYMDSSDWTLDFYIFSEEELDISNVTVDIPVESSYSLLLSELYLGEAPGTYSDFWGDNILFTYDVYLNYLGFDWTELADKFQKMTAAEETAKTEKTSEARQAYSAAQKEYSDYYNQYQDEYWLLDETMLPQFHGYKLMVTFDYGEIPVDEAFNSLTIKVGDQVLPLDIGEVRLHCSSRFSYDYDAFEYIDASMASSRTLHVPSANYQHHDHLIALKDFMLTGYEVHLDNIEIGDIYLQIQSESKGARDFLWDGKTPLEIMAGDKVELNTTLVIPQLANQGAALNCFVQFVCEADGVELKHTYETVLGQVSNYYEEYAKFYHGIDFTKYYEAYYYPCVMEAEA